MSYDLNAIMESFTTPSKQVVVTKDDPSTTIATESDHGTTITAESDRSTTTTYEQPFLWGSVTMGPAGTEKDEKGIHVYLTQGEVYIYITGPDDRFANLYPFMSQIESGTKVHVFLYSDCVVEHAAFLQTCLMDCPGETHTYLSMVGISPYTSATLCIYAYGQVLEPVPYGIVALCEPMTDYHCMGRSTSSVQLYSTVAQSIITTWYNKLLERGLFTEAEISEVIAGNSVVVKDFNNRIR